MCCHAPLRRSLAPFLVAVLPSTTLGFAQFLLRILAPVFSVKTWCSIRWRSSAWVTHNCFFNWISKVLMSCSWIISLNTVFSLTTSLCLPYSWYNSLANLWTTFFWQLPPLTASGATANIMASLYSQHLFDANGTHRIRQTHIQGQYLSDTALLHLICRIVITKQPALVQ